MTFHNEEKEASVQTIDASFSKAPATNNTKIILVTGMSGAGKSFALKTLEDIGYEAIDNIPLTILPLLVQPDGNHSKQLAIGIDIRNRDFSIERFEDKLLLLRNRQDLDVELLFMDCSDDVLQQRFSETRRKHPMDNGKRVLDSIQQERKLISILHDYADYIIDSSTLNLPELRRWIKSHFHIGLAQLSICIRSFSYRKGIPREADIIFDTRFLRNPHYDAELQIKTGQDKDVADYIMADPDFETFFSQLYNMVLPLLPRFQEEGKSYLTIAFGCTGGRHRSVFTAEAFAKKLQNSGFSPTIEHRDLP